MSRDEALKRVEKIEQNQDRIVVPFDHNPRLLPPGKIMKKHHNTLVRKNPYLKQVFKSEPMPALRQGKNLRRLLCRAKLSPSPTTRPTRTTRSTTGWRRCSLSSPGGRQCPICAFTMDPTTEVVGQVTGYKHTITDNVNCQTKNVIYYWKCCKPNCPDHPYTEYIGKSTLSFQKRFSQHRDYVKRDQNEEPSGAHFNLVPGHSVSDMKGLVLEHCKSSDPYILSVRERYYINKFNSYRAGLNKTS